MWVHPSDPVRIYGKSVSDPHQQALRQWSSNPLAPWDARYALAYRDWGMRNVPSTLGLGSGFSLKNPEKKGKWSYFAVSCGDIPSHIALTWALYMVGTSNLAPSNQTKVPCTWPGPNSCPQLRPKDTLDPLWVDSPGRKWTTMEISWHGVM